MLICSFARRAQEPSPCNLRLAETAERIIEVAGEDLVIVAQLEVARKLVADGVETTHVVEPFLDGSYLDTDYVWIEARLYFEELGVEEVIIVANPFLHAFSIERMVRKDGFKICQKYTQMLGRIGFDPESQQWWTRGPLRLLIYAGLSALRIAKYFR